MTLKEFLKIKTINMIEIAKDYGVIINVYNNHESYGLDVELNMIPNTYKLTLETDFTLENDILTVAGISININDVTMLGM